MIKKIKRTTKWLYIVWFVNIDRDGGNGTNGNCIQFKLNIVLMNVYLHYNQLKNIIFYFTAIAKADKRRIDVFIHTYFGRKKLSYTAAKSYSIIGVCMCVCVCGCIGIYFSHCVTSMSTEKSLFHMHLCALLREALDQINKIMSAQNVQSI